MEFSKYSGTGNDFLLIDNRDFEFPKENRELISHFCTSLTADGIILLESPTVGGDFKMRILNSDGSEAEMCGNGIRCLFQFLLQLGFPKKSYAIETLSGMKYGSYEGAEIAIDMGPPGDLELGLSVEGHMVQSIDTGVPHAVLFKEKIDLDECRKIGRSLLKHPKFGPKGTNVTFAQETGPSSLQFCTFERGVEEITLSCGTGATAAALVYSFVRGATSPIAVSTLQGEVLTISFEKSGIDFSNVIMKGSAVLLFEGKLDILASLTQGTFSNG